jgi:cytochrome b6-f complex iron-sulfur subunit
LTIAPTGPQQCPKTPKRSVHDNQCCPTLDEPWRGASIRFSAAIESFTRFECASLGFLHQNRLDVSAALIVSAWVIGAHDQVPIDRSQRRPSASLISLERQSGAHEHGINLNLARPAWSRRAEGTLFAANTKRGTRVSSRRRTFLKVLAASPLLACSGTALEGPSGSGQGVAGSGAGGSGAGDTGGSAGSSAATPGDEPGGNVSATSVGTLLVLANSPIVLGRDAQGLYAMTIVCPHQGCYVAPQGSELYCPCHGSLFDSNGNVLRGPARAPLTHFAVSVDAAGNITIHTGSLVAATVRTAA